MGDRKLRFGVIGTGAFAEACHVPGLQSHPEAEVAVVCGRRLARASALAGRLGVPEATDDAAALCARDDIDGVTICTPNASHRELALLAFAHGKHVFCEKPLGLSVAEAEEMARAADESGRVHQVAFTFRYLFGVEELRRRLREGEIGEPLYLTGRHEHPFGQGKALGWRGLPAESGSGVLFDTGSHLFDLALWLLGPLTEVEGGLLAVQGVPAPEGEAPSATEDIAAARFRFASGARGSLYASRVTPARIPNHVRVTGREGALEAELSRGRMDRLRIAPAGEHEWRDLPLPAPIQADEAYALGRMMRSFVDACQAGALTERDASFADGLAVQRAMAAVARDGWGALL